MYKRKYFSIFTFLIVASSFHLFGSELTVKGEATLFKAADEISFSVDVITRETTAENALKSNTQKIEQVIGSFKSAGLNSSEYSTGSFSVRPIYSQRPENPPPSWKAEIVAYEVTNSLNIKTGKMEQAGQLLDVAVKAGADNIGNIQFGITDPRKYRQEAIEQASKNAIADAKALASATGVKLGSPVSIELDDVKKTTPNFQVAYRTLESVPIEPGEIEVHASVTISYKLYF